MYIFPFSFAGIVMSHSNPLHFFPFLQHVPIRFCVLYFHATFLFFNRPEIFEIINSFQYIPYFLYGYRFPCSLCSKGKSIHLVVGLVTLISLFIYLVNTAPKCIINYYSAIDKLSNIDISTSLYTNHGCTTGRDRKGATMGDVVWG